MPCDFPLNGWKSRTPNKSGKFSITFNASEGYIDQPRQAPCGQCNWCRLNRSRTWAMRCLHEAQMWEHNCFITLTYAPEHLPSVSCIRTRREYASLQKNHFQEFMNRLRSHYTYSPKNDPRPIQDHIRYYMCGEYGDENDRPHYHAILFNCRFHDQTKWKIYRGNQYYKSQTLTDLWRFGHAAIGQANFKTAAYIARYILKKQLGKSSLNHYTSCDSNGEIIHERLPEYTDMSRGYGIGKEWFEKFKTDVFPSDTVIVNEKEMRPPKYYDRLFEKTNPKEMELIKIKRMAIAKEKHLKEDPYRAVVRDECLSRKLKQLPRSYENGTENIHDL